MGKFLLEIPENIHNKLRHKSIDENEDMSKIIIKAIKKYIKRDK